MIFNRQSFISVSCEQGLRDEEIVQASGFLNLLQPGDCVMANKGFNIQDLLALHDVRLIAPPIMAENKVSARASTATRRDARARVHMERMIRKPKCYRILRGVIHLSLKGYITSIVNVCAALVNMQPSVIRFESNGHF